MTESLRQKAERFIALESSPSRREWHDLVRELLDVADEKYVHQIESRTHPFPPYDRTGWMGETLSEERLKEFQKWLDSKNTVDPSGISDHVIVPCPSND